jgi:hypothetical protein
MWKRLKQALSSVGAANSAARTRLGGFYLYRVSSPGGLHEVVSLLPPEQVTNEGLCAEAIIGSYAGIVEERDLVEGFRPNRVFLEVLHSVIAAHVPMLPAAQDSARRQGSGAVLVIDARTPTPGGQVPSRDVLGAFSVEDGAIVPDSYQPNPHHQLLSADGLFQLEPTLHQRLIERIHRLPDGSATRERR